ncbi:MAG TPA: 2,3-bisphosphoglycerate-independent phosphoglycerate mutase [Deltaproteobacteria bacterium]|nr:2,3-bisphosphoglycerate-independent phosphoglycerate mutase [Deltaproteobacteria bacterium]
MDTEIIEKLIAKNEKKIIFLIMDGLGGLPKEPGGKTELETAMTPNLDRLAAQGSTGLLDPVGIGITPGSGPAHFALFGYDPVKYNVGRGLLSAAGLNFELTPGDLYMRANFATLDKFGHIADRRAGRLETDKNKLLCIKLKANVRLQNAKEVFFVTEKEHRALVVLRGGNFSEQVSETDPQKTGVEPIEAQALAPEADDTAAAIRELSGQVKNVLRQEQQANALLLRGYSGYHEFPSFSGRFGLKPLAIASYPMYKGVARLLKMTLAEETNTIEEEIQQLASGYGKYNFFYVHIKATDSRGEDGNFEEKIKVIERVDSLLPEILSLNPDVLVVTGDHSTPAVMASHSFHPVPVLLWAKNCRADSTSNFGETACLSGSLGRMPMKKLMAIALAHAGKLQKFGA